MPVDNSLGIELVQTLSSIYGNIENRMVQAITRQLQQRIDLPNWIETRLAGISDLQRQAQKLIELLTSDVGPQVEQTLLLAYQRGSDEAQAEIDRVTGMTIPDPAPSVGAVQALAFRAASTVQGTHLRILRWSLDAYREVITATAPDVLLGTQTRRQAAQAAWDRLLSRGITGFIDRSGRSWELASYVEMAMRTATAQAAVQGHLDRLGSAGIDLVRVSDSPRECERCRPWEGKILSRSGLSGQRTIEVQHTTQDRMITVHVRGTVLEATAAGLMHPNCTHSLSAYFPGVSKRPSRPTQNPHGYEERQRLRALERHVREWKRREAGALDEIARKHANEKVRYWQGQIREHVATTGILRQRQREQIGVAR